MASDRDRVIGDLIEHAGLDSDFAANLKSRLARAGVETSANVEGAIDAHESPVEDEDPVPQIVSIRRGRPSGAFVGWSGSSLVHGHGYYQLQVAIDSGFGDVLDDVATASTWAIVEEITVGAGKWARVRAVDAAGTVGEWSDGVEVEPLQVDTGDYGDGSVTDEKVQSLTADKITAGTINAGVIDVINLNANNITAGTISADRIGAGEIEATISIDAPTFTLKYEGGGRQPEMEIAIENDGAEIGVTDGGLVVDVPQGSINLIPSGLGSLQYSGSEVATQNYVQSYINSNDPFHSHPYVNSGTSVTQTMNATLNNTNGLFRASDGGTAPYMGLGEDWRGSGLRVGRSDGTTFRFFDGHIGALEGTGDTNYTSINADSFDEQSARASKRDIEPLDSALNTVLATDVVTFAKKHRDADKRRVGVIADDLPDLLRRDVPDERGERVSWAVSGVQLAAFAWRAIQELADRMEETQGG
ncbi:tail fiber domain-containing protein [Egibacter rhizosphaerae]|uniref:Tail fiber domain-containing protein n=1 Tax=Egibacter rhizosphaerae TaxID=1670831 RepID=A0A411YDP2_9ACTN|nr:tail fiber domain-containing protein [Egibacter rhizosphaerae]QBI19354.1 tail fiber domain-containing protein [Egibacter rhizosphaerae]